MDDAMNVGSVRNAVMMSRDRGRSCPLRQGERGTSHGEREGGLIDKLGE